MEAFTLGCRAHPVFLRLLGSFGGSQTISSQRIFEDIHVFFSLSFILLVNQFSVDWVVIFPFFIVIYFANLRE